MSTLVLVTGLFDDAELMETALAGADDTVRLRLDSAAMNEEDWDEVVKQLLSAKKVVTI